MSEKRYCSKCGNELNKDDIFCHICGKKVKSDRKKFELQEWQKILIRAIIVLAIFIGIARLSDWIDKRKVEKNADKYMIEHRGSMEKVNTKMDKYKNKI